jgi:hypothetical protein
MLPKIHIILGGFFSIIIYFVFSISFFQASLIFLSSFLIDFDHYLYYIFIKKDFNLKRAHRWFVKKRYNWIALSKDKRSKFKLPIFIFHGIELLIILILFYFLNKIFLEIIIGVLFHMSLDFIELYYFKMPLYSKMSQVYVHFKNKNKPEFNV